PGPHQPPAPAATTTPEPRATATDGDPTRGHTLVERFQCNRCHEGTGLPEPRVEQACVGCHEDVLSGKSRARADVLPRLQKNLVSLRFAPSLVGIGARTTPAFISGYLLAPHDLRPGLPATMPRLAISPAEARDIAAYLSSRSPSADLAPAAAPSPAEV